MALGRFKEVSQGVLSEHAEIARGKINEAIVDQNPQAVVDATRRHQIILSESGNVFTALVQIQDAFARMGLGLDPISVEDLLDPIKLEPKDNGEEREGDTVFTPLTDTSPQALTPDDEPDPFALPDSPDTFFDDPVVLPDGFAGDEDLAVTSPGVASFEGTASLEVSSREKQIIEAVFGLDRDRRGLMYRKFAYAVSAILSGELPPKGTPESFQQFGNALRVIGDFTKDLIRDLEISRVDPSSLTEDRLKQVGRFTEYLASQGYPENISPEVLDRIRIRKGTNRTFLRNTLRNPREEQEKGGLSSQDPIIIVDLSRTRAESVQNPRNGMFGLKPVQGKDFHIASPAPSRVDVPDPEAEMRREAEANRKIIQAVLEMNDQQEPIHVSLRDIALSLLGSKVSDLSSDERDKAADEYVSRFLTPFIYERIRAKAALDQRGAGNLNLQQKKHAQELAAGLMRFGYPSDLSPAEVGLIMSRQTTLPALLARKEGVAGLPERNTKAPKPETDGHHNKEVAYKKVDRLTDVQRRFMEIIFATTADGLLAHASRESAIAAMYPKEYQEAVNNNDKKALALLAAHFGRSGSAVCKMIQNAISGDHAPAELRATLVNLKKSPHFEGFENSQFLDYAQRFLA